MNTEDTFQKIYEEYKNLIFWLVYDMTKNSDLAQDICQETFLKLYSYRGYVDTERVKNWLLLVAERLVIDYFRSAARRREQAGDCPELQNLAAADALGEYLERQAAGQFCGRIMDALREKNEVWYDVLMLVEYLGVPRKRVAKQYGVALSTIDYYLRKSKDWLKTQFREEYEQL